MSGGSNVGGATSVTRAPRAVNACTSLRATRLCLTSPMIVMCRPSNPVVRLRHEADGVAVEQRLGGVLMPAVAGVHDRRSGPLCDLLRRAV